MSVMQDYTTDMLLFNFVYLYALYNQKSSLQEPHLSWHSHEVVVVQLLYKVVSIELVRGYLVSSSVSCVSVTDFLVNLPSLSYS